MKLKQPKTKRAVVLLSGGLDSTTVLYYALKKGCECHCLLFDYGQRHRKELALAKSIAKKAGCPSSTIKISLPWDAGSLVDRSRSIPARRNLTVRPEKLPSTYVPGRNTIFVSFALSYAESIDASSIFIGANAIDFSGYPDCRPGYYTAWNKVLKALGMKIKVEAPLVHLNKAEIIRLGTKLGVPYGTTWSCYAGGTRPCGVCDSCRFRAKGFAAAGLSDPALSRK